MQWIGLVAVSLLSTVYTLILKKIQKDHIASKYDYFVFIFYLNVVQSIIHLLIPPHDALQFPRESILLGIASGITILVYYIFMLLALATGPLVLSNSIMALYLLIPIFYGTIFWQESLSILIGFGLILFASSIFIISNSSYYEHDKEKKIEWKWFIFVLLAFACNGINSVLAKQHALMQPDLDKEFLLLCRWVNVLVAGPACILAGFRFKKANGSEKSTKQARSSDTMNILNPNKIFLLYCLAAGAVMAVANTIFMYMVSRLSSAYFFPVTQAFSMIFMFVLSRLIFRERLNKKGLLGYGMLSLAVLLISIG